MHVLDLLLLLLCQSATYLAHEMLLRFYDNQPFHSVQANPDSIVLETTCGKVHVSLTFS